MLSHLTALRFELEDDDGRYPSLYFEHLVNTLRYDSQPKLSQPNPQLSSISQTLKDKVKGRRIFQQISIETIFQPGMSKNSSAVATDNNKEGEWCLVKGKRQKPSNPNKIDCGNIDPSTREVQQRQYLSATTEYVPLAPALASSDTLDFYYGNPSTQITRGILHIYKDTRLTDLNEGGASDMICVLGIPSTRYTTHRLLQFLKPFLPSLTYVRIIRDSSPHSYMALLKFGGLEVARRFYDAYNGIPYNDDHVNNCHAELDDNLDSIPPSPPTCHLVYVGSVECQKAGSFWPFPPPGTTELPKCIVCMERMEESVEGILTVLCDHSFHTACLAQWTDPTCPVCRYVQTGAPQPAHELCAPPFGLISSYEGGDEDPNPNECLEVGCGTRADLWICLVCGNVGCGRYLGGHASSHWQLTQHTYAMELETGRVWDYTGDNYVHRLIQAKGDGKIVEYVREGGTLTILATNHHVAPGALKPAKKGGREGKRKPHRPPTRNLDCEDSILTGTKCNFCGKNMLPDNDNDDGVQIHGGVICDCWGDEKSEDSELDDGEVVIPLSDEAEKFDSISLEYSYLMSQQLQTQRAYFKGEMERVEHELTVELSRCRDQMERSDKELKASNALYEACVREKERGEKRYAHLSSKFEKVLKDLIEERNINACLNQNQDQLKKDMARLESSFSLALSSKDAQIEELQEQMRDIMFHLNAQERIQSSQMSNEIKEGNIEIPSPPAPSITKKGVGRKNKTK